MARAAAQLCEALARRGHEVTVFTARLQRDHPREERRNGVRVRRLSSPPPFARLLMPWTPGLGRAFRGTADRFAVAHVHGHRSPMAWRVAPLLRRAGVPWVFQPHGTFPHHGRRGLFKDLVDRVGADAVWRDAGAVVAVSRSEAADLPVAAHVIGNGVAGLPGAAVERRGERLLFVGSEHPQKRPGLLPPLLRALPGTTLTVVGRVGWGFARRFGRDAPRVEVRGPLDPDALARACAESTVVIHPAVGEAFGFVPFEAALLGTPAVVAGGHGCGEWFGAAGGCVVPPDDGDALTRAVAQRLADRRLGEAEAAGVARYCREQLTWERAAESVEGVYRAIAAPETA